MSRSKEHYLENTKGWTLQDRMQLFLNGQVPAKASAEARAFLGKKPKTAAKKAVAKTKKRSKKSA